ncbi:NLP/P60 protein [Proteiniborus sp. DW1]|uniref:C40 family peptidase n=1 Tax=Proteiniborus sp. DW1 TaxID=1889883 RepID=UPI00092E0ACC|nr:SH3 domain-containing C40 family peptidase [Proteiniborus sp. DW1]SCG82287.1 NLP/P60 protein [Proteiniborus sp. DW1]
MKLAIVTSTIAPLMLEPKFNTEKIDEALCGMTLEILEELSNGWYYCITGYRYKGYVHDSCISIDTEKTCKWKEEAKNIINHRYVDVLAKPKYQSHIIHNLVKGSRIKLTDETSDVWSKIILPDGRKGWIKSVYISQYLNSFKNIPEEELRNNLVNTALDYMGTQYRWGGKSHLGIDCSGLCSIAYLINGATIYRDAQIKEGYDMREISREELNKGDLIFFPGHVAMYIGGDKYIHSSSKNSGVRINSLNPKHIDYWGELAKTIIKYGSIFKKQLRIND